MWNCTKCAEEVEDTFDVCWNCGTSRDGREDPDFTREVCEAGQPELRVTLRGCLAAIWRFVAAPPRPSVPRWLSCGCTVVILAAYVLIFVFVVIASDGRQLAEELDQAADDYYSAHPHSNLPGVVFMIPLFDYYAYYAYIFGIILFIALFTLMTWRWHGIWTKAIAFLPFFAGALIGLVCSIIGGP